MLTFKIKRAHSASCGKVCHSPKAVTQSSTKQGGSVKIKESPYSVAVNRGALFHASY